MATTTAQPDLSRAAVAAASLARRPAPGLVREGSAGPAPLFTRHSRGVIEAERARRRQRAAVSAASFVSAKEARLTAKDVHLHAGSATGLER